MEEKLKNSTNKSGTKAKIDGYYHGSDILGKLWSITVAGKDILEFLCNDEEFEELVACLRVNDAEKLKAQLSDELVFTHRTINGNPLKGLLNFGEDAVTVDFKDLPDDHMIPQVIEAQRNYVAYRMIAKCRKVLVAMMNRRWTKMELEDLEELEKMNPKKLRRLTELTDVLIESMTEEEREENGWGTLRERIDEVVNN